MADFESLIRKALAKQPSYDENVRLRVYNSSRSALKRMLEAKDGITQEQIGSRQAMLEESIRRVENEFRSAESGPAVDPASAIKVVDEILQEVPEQPENLQMEAEVPLQDMHSASVHPEPVDSTSLADSLPANPAEMSALDPAAIPLDPVLSDPAADAGPYPETSSSEDADFAASYRARRNTIRWLGIAGLILILALVGWVGYLLITSLADGIRLDPGQRATKGVSALQPIGGEDQNFKYITIIEGADPSAIVTDGRGTAAIIEEQGFSYLRIISVRSGSNRKEPAEPILLELKPGVLEQISGKRVTVEILAKSGSTGPTTFSVECALGSYGECGRKRFRVGLQPEAVVFSIEFENGAANGDPAYLAINTDIASTANLTGKGDVLDIQSARLRVLEEE